MYQFLPIKRLTFFLFALYSSQEKGVLLISSKKIVANAFIHYSEDVEFVLFGKSNCKFNCWAICEVEGGPEYKISLIGEASTVSYSFDKSFLDFGFILYTVY